LVLLPHHIEIGTVSLPASSRCIDLDTPALCRNRFFRRLHLHSSHQSTTALSITLYPLPWPSKP